MEEGLLCLDLGLLLPTSRWTKAGADLRGCWFLEEQVRFVFLLILAFGQLSLGLPGEGGTVTLVLRLPFPGLESSMLPGAWRWRMPKSLVSVCVEQVQKDGTEET